MTIRDRLPWDKEFLHFVVMPFDFDQDSDYHAELVLSATETRVNQRTTKVK